MEYLAIVLGLILLIKGGDWVLEGAVLFSLRLNIPKIIVGMTVVSFATSAPELIVSINAALNGYPDLAVGNIVGSNIANLALVLGIVVFITPIKIDKVFYKYDWPAMILVTLLFYFSLKSDYSLSLFESVLFIIVLIAYLIFLIFYQKSRVNDQEELNVDKSMKYLKILSLIIFGGFFLWLGSEVLIKGSISLATKLGISERIIGVTIVAFGTSIPELSTSIVAIINKEQNISLGNLIGSNIFDMLGVIGITGILSPIVISDIGLIDSDLIWMLSLAFLILPLVFFPNKMKFGRIEGVILLLFYAFFINKLI
ncbi:calcium/sodium antiporter [Flavobacteriaceae bacterium]|jgi:cation:H+ antiporter|nr:calcium/sodium antiporter [Flavobacteriaceae bacterium]MDA9628513.1 calcium/sodium antiporter [Flavobacteriaceae bacterium]MDG1686529.1 calcium/sodium antiporter [Flavobacteriaceae bacterium]|tara:strand:+ start:956 stop:1891 length:936 start_codon:yes stop_codon:yes gene_type:complete